MQSYFYLDQHNAQCGPVSPDHFAENGVTPQTLVWCSGMDNWTPACQVAELQSFFATRPAEGATPPPPPPPGSYANSYGPQPTGSAPYSGYTPPPMPCPDTHLVEALVITICCCLPFGVVALVKAFQVTSFYNEGNYDQALFASQDARKWSMIGLIAGILSFALGSGWFWLMPSW